MTHLADGAVLRPSIAQGILRHPMMAPVLLSMLAILAISAPNLLDPMIRFDDYPALFADAGAYWHKTKDEGRWLNYLWHLRGITTPAWLNFLLYQLLWSLFAAFLAIAALRDVANRAWFATVLALLVLVAPSATMISLWFNTLLPGLALIALYAGLGLVVSRRTHLALMVPMTVLTFMAYTTYPLLLLATAITCSKERSLRDLITLLSVFCFSFVLAVLCVYSLNLSIHGVFGVQVADWRNATPGTDWTSLLGNLPLLSESLRDFLSRSSFDFSPMIWFHLTLLTLATGVLLRRVPMEALYLHAGLAMGLALIVVQVLKVGVIAPPRAFIFAWVFYALLVVRAAQLLTDKGGLAGRFVRNAVLLIAGSYLLQTFMQYTTYRDWQSETRALAETVQATEAPMAIADDILDLPSARSAFVQNNLALSFRLQQLTGKIIPVCVGASGPCCPEIAATGGRCPTLLRVRTHDGVPHIVLE
ncbi:hypothetical protein [Primorskyibacter sp. 2E233]|uniref:hypothetical protein n=1 Tax=Primorskyibacter sp. 2E233 TaxID=3413431 RepID=UPI003BF20B0A